MKIQFTILSFLVFLFVGCTSEEYIQVEPENKDDGIKILQERASYLPPRVTTRPIETENSVSRSLSGINTDEKLGFSYASGNSILGDIDNVGLRVIDIAKVKMLGSDYVVSKAEKKLDETKFSFADYDSFANYLKQTEKIHSGFSIDLLGFKLGRKKEHDRVFNKSILTSASVVYGELDMNYKEASFGFADVEGALNLYARECVSEVFLRNLYSSTIGNIIDSYGEYVITGYYTGGKACALLAGIGNASSSKTQRENDMLNDINASFTWKDKGSAGANYSFGKLKGDSASYVYKTQSIYAKLVLLGGVPFGAAINSADKLDNIDVDMNQWVTSLSDPSNHSIIDFTRSGLCQLSDVVIETNFKRRFKDTASEILYPFPALVTPYIEITRVFVRYGLSGEALYDIAPVLFTRQGDRIILHVHDTSLLTDAELRSNESATVFDQKANEIKQQKQDFYDLEIRSNSVKRLNPIVGNPLCIDLGVVSENDMAVYSNPNTGIHYIHDRKRKIAFSYLVDRINGDWILDDYGIRDWVESLPSKSVNMATLASSYTIIGL